MRNCLMYRLSYYRFGEVRLSFQQPSGYDMNRRAVVGDKNIHLKYFEEAFTSEHWIVRIYRVKKEQPTNPSVSYLTKQEKSKEEADTTENYRYIGCTSYERAFSDDKVYAGGAIGASYQLAKEHALTNRKKYFAIAKLGNDGHVFAFNKLVLPLNPNNNGGCDRHCEDDLDKVCGCADNTCTGSKYYIDLIK